MRSLLLAVLVSWACAEGVAPQQPRPSAAPNATADATEEKTTNLVQAPEEQQEEQEEEQEEQAEEPQEEQEQPTPAPAKPFSYDEWTAELPTRGMPKIPGPPFPYLNSGGKKGAFDQLRKYRWDVWEYEQAVMIERDYLNKWREWERNIPQSTLDRMEKIQQRNLNICGYWKSSSEVPSPVNGFGPDFEELKRLVIEFKKYQGAYLKAYSFGRLDLVRSHGGEAALRWHDQLATVVKEIIGLEKFIDGTRAAEKISRDVLYAIDGCSDDMPLLNLCPHPFIYSNLWSSDCDLF